MIRRPPRSTRTDTLFPYTTLFRSGPLEEECVHERVLHIDEDRGRRVDGGELFDREYRHEETTAGASECFGNLDPHETELEELRSEERRVAKACVGTCRSGW